MSQQQHRGGERSAESVPGPTHTHADTALKHNGGVSDDAYLTYSRIASVYFLKLQKITGVWGFFFCSSGKRLAQNLPKSMTDLIIKCSVTDSVA